MMIPPQILSMVRERVAAGQVVVGGHVLLHGEREGFVVDDVLAAIMQGLIIEHYADRAGCLIAARIRTAAGRLLWLHVVCTYRHPVWVGIVTAYVPDPAAWEFPPLRRR
jgi:hypothetical protein